MTSEQEDHCPATQCCRPSNGRLEGALNVAQGVRRQSTRGIIAESICVCSGGRSLASSLCAASCLCSHPGEGSFRLRSEFPVDSAASFEKGKQVEGKRTHAHTHTKRPPRRLPHITPNSRRARGSCDKTKDPNSIGSRRGGGGETATLAAEECSLLEQRHLFRRWQGSGEAGGYC